MISEHWHQDLTVPARNCNSSLFWYARPLTAGMQHAGSPMPACYGCGRHSKSLVFQLRKYNTLCALTSFISPWWSSTQESAIPAAAYMLNLSSLLQGPSIWRLHRHTWSYEGTNTMAVTLYALSSFPKTGIGIHAEVCLMYELYRPARSGLLIILSSVSLVTCTMHKLLNRGPTKTQGAPTLAPNSAKDHQNSCSKK